MRANTRIPRFVLVAALIAVLLVMSGETVRAVPYRSYIYNIWESPVPAPQAYVPEAQISARRMGLDSLSGPQDMHITDDGRIFILDTGNHRIVCLDQNWNLVSTISTFDVDGETGSFRNPQGLFVTERDEIWVADRDNNRVVVVTTEGDFVKIIGAPRTDVEGVLPADFTYLPLNLVVDRAGRLYVIADNVYEGFVEFDVDGNFRGFMGAPRVAPSVADVFWNRFATQEQRARQALFLPTHYSSVDLDPRGFMFATIASGDIGIRRLNLSGADVTRRLGFVPPIGDFRWWLDRSTLVDVKAREHGMYSLLDRRRGRVFTYDENGNLLYVFGGRGDQLGTFRNPVAISTLGDQIVVLDSATNMVTTFNPTEYARDIHAAIAYYDRGDYDRSTETWLRVVQQNVNYDLAYSGIGRALLRQEQYDDAMYYLRLGQDRTAYSEAWWRYRRELLGENFGTMVTLGLLAILLFYLALKYHWFIMLGRKILGQPANEEASAGEAAAKKPGLLRGTLQALAYAFHVIFHPYDGFWDMKYEKRGNAFAATIILLLVTGTYVYMRQYTGFLFNYRDLTQLNIFVEMASIVIPVVVWVMVNWALTTLMEGKGNQRDIYIATAYALTPLILINVPVTFLSNFITIEEGSLYYMAITVAGTWSFALLFLGTMVTHEYDMGKTAFTSVLIGAGMVIVLFIALLFFTLIDQVVAFVNDIYSEIVFRL